jgi:HTH-type transcriptional regulator/antitoxin HigA
MDDFLVLNERDAARARNALGRIDSSLTPANSLRLAAQGLPPALISRHTTMLKARRAVFAKALEVFDSLRGGELDAVDDWRKEPGVVLVLARIARGLSQRDLAGRLGMKEQQVQRYEADYYSTISLANLRKIAAFLNVEIQAKVAAKTDDLISDLFELAHEVSAQELQKVVRFVRRNDWLPEKYLSAADNDASAALIQYVASARDKFGSPALLRTGLNTEDYHKDLSLLAWRARASEIAQTAAAKIEVEFDPTDISWLKTLVQASRQEDGPRQAERIMAEHGVALIVIPHVPGLRLDGAAFIEGAIPVVALTIRYDRVDSFWFTLLHELGHIYLHLYSGLRLGFYDDIDHEKRDAAELEANEFAGACIISDEQWKTSPARVTKSEGAVERLADSLSINPALLFGRIRKERGNYKIFTDRVGQGGVRRWWQDNTKEPGDGWTDD